MKRYLSILLGFVMLFANINVQAEKEKYTEALKSGLSEYEELWSFAKDKFSADIELIDEENIVCVETFTSMERVREDRAISVELFIPILNSEKAYVAGFTKMNSSNKSDNFVTDEFMGIAKAEDVVYLNPVWEVYNYSYLKNNNFDKIEKMKVILYSYRLYMFCYNIVNNGSEYLIPFYRLPNDGNNASYNLTNEDDLEFEMGKAYTIDEFCDILSKEQEAFEEYNSNRVGEDTYYYQEDGETKLHTPEPTPTITPTASPTPTATPTPTASPTASPTPTPTTSPTPSVEPEKIIEVTTGESIEVKAGGEKVKFTDVNPFVDENNRTQMPIRVLGETLGFDVNWDGNDKTAILKAPGTLITIRIGENEILKNGETIQMDTTAKVINDRTYIPLRSIAEAVGYTVEWK